MFKFLWKSLGFKASANLCRLFFLFGLWFVSCKSWAIHKNAINMALLSPIIDFNKPGPKYFWATKNLKLKITARFTLQGLGPMTRKQFIRFYLLKISLPYLLFFRIITSIICIL